MSKFIIIPAVLLLAMSCSPHHNRNDRQDRSYGKAQPELRERRAQPARQDRDLRHERTGRSERTERRWMGRQ